MEPSVYRCLICGSQFDEPHFVRERQYHSEVDCTEDGGHYVCPVCGESYFKEVPDEENET